MNHNGVLFFMKNLLSLEEEDRHYRTVCSHSEYAVLCSSIPMRRKAPGVVRVWFWSYFADLRS